MSARLLVVEDDPVSAEFLGEVLRRQHSVVCCPSLAEAKRESSTGTFDLVLVDMHLGDDHGTDLIAWLRSDACPASPPACIALSAEFDEDLVACLYELGCRHILAKPMTVAQLDQAVSRALGSIPPPARADAPPAIDHETTTSIWDDDAALLALGGQRDVLGRLRDLMRADLPGQRARIAEAHRHGQFDTLDEELHRLRAACGFCGAAALASACQAFKHGHDADRLHELLLAIDAVLDHPG